MSVGKHKILKVIIAIGVIVIGVNIYNRKMGDENKVYETITISGSTALLPLMDSSYNSFKTKNPNDVINIQAGGSGTGLTQVLNGTVNIGTSDMSAFDKLDKENATKLVDHKVVGEGFGVAVSKGSGVSNLTDGELRDIFSGEITNWKEVRGNDEPILVIHRPASSGTRNTFTEKILNGNKSLENDSIGTIQDSNGAVLDTMESSNGAISYIALAYIKNKPLNNVRLININGIEPSIKNIEDGKYTFWSWGHMYTKGEAAGLSKSFIEYIESSQNAENIRNLGFIPREKILNSKEKFDIWKNESLKIN